ncbi:MAG: Rhomboid protease GlpG [Chlamydiae bacterium]|nr:Rhomboid protease GlpG [Chlamydiota bacterium]
MRLVVSIENHEKAQKFHLFLLEKKIKSQVEQKSTESHIWVFNEDDIPLAQKAYKEFEDNPNWAPSQEALQEELMEKLEAQNIVDSRERQSELNEEDVPAVEEENKLNTNQAQSQGFGKLTVGVIILCIFLFTWAVFSAPKKIDYSGHTLDIGLNFTVPYNQLTYENPLAFQYAYEFIRDYQNSEDHAAFLGTQGAFQQMYRYQTTPYWHGYYETYFVPAKAVTSLNKAFTESPTFEQIAQGDIWRLVSPAFLHANLFHILFNLIWFAFLGTQMESRIGFWKFTFFIIIVALVSNTAQYLMSGPNFLGLSGVIMGMAGFIYMRQSKAAWEGYSIQRPTLYFLAFYVIALCALQVVSFALELSGKRGIAPNIANTAHVVGALMGLGLGSLNFFSAWNLGKLKK